MAIFKYTLPSGATYQLDAPAGTTQAQADKIFYEQVAAGTFVGYKKGDTLTHPAEALSNFGITRIERGTAGVDDQTLLAIISGLPIVAPLPTLATVPIVNPIDQANYIEVTSNPEGVFSLPPTAVGQLDPTQVQAIMAQTAAVVDQHFTVVTTDAGVGKYGFNCKQLERAGLIKPGMCELYCPTDPNTGANPPNFVQFMTSPTPWTGLNGVNSVTDITVDEATQNHIQEQLMKQSYQQLVDNGTIVPPTPTVTTPSISTGQVYSSSGTLVQTTALTLIASGLGYNGANALFSDFTNLFSSTSATGLYTQAVSVLGSAGNTIDNLTSSLSSNPLGTITSSLEKLGGNAVAEFSSALSSLSSGAVGFASNALDNITNSTGNAVTQLSGLATGLTGGNVANVAASISSTINSDVGALVANSSKYGTALTTAWAQGSTAITTIGSDLQAAGNAAIAQGQAALAGVEAAYTAGKEAITAGLDKLGKASQFSVNFSDFSLSSLVAGVQPAAAFNNTVNRATLDAAVNRIIGSEKISPPVFELPSLSSLGTLADISAAKNLLSQAQTVASNIGNQVVNIQGQATGLLNTAQAQVNNVTRTI